MVLKIGHRGAKGYEPENTLLSFRKAVELNVDMVEFDVCICATGEVVVFHDKRVDLIPGCEGYVSGKTFHELREYDLGKGQKIPTLQEVLDIIDKRIQVNIEIKGEDTAIPVYNIIDNYVKEKGWRWEDFLISSFNQYELLRFKSVASNVRIGVIIAGIPIDLAECAQKLNAYSLHLSKEFIARELVDDAHKRGLRVFVYTPNHPEDIACMKSLGVDGIFSDYPDRI